MSWPLDFITELIVKAKESHQFKAQVMRSVQVTVTVIPHL